jgi:mRNA interferase HicA
VDGNEFLRRVRDAGSAKGLPVTVDYAAGKGSHARLHVGDRVTTLKDRKKEIGPGLLLAMLKQLGLTKRDIGL